MKDHFCQVSDTSDINPSYSVLPRVTEIRQCKQKIRSTNKSKTNLENCSRKSTQPRKLGFESSQSSLQKL